MCFFFFFFLLWLYIKCKKCLSLGYYRCTVLELGGFMFDNELYIYVLQYLICIKIIFQVVL